MFEKDPLSTLFKVVVGAQAAMLVLMLLIALRRPGLGAAAARRAWGRLGTLAERRGWSVAAVAALSLALNAALGAVHWPIPRIQDEFSYLLAADTFAHGRLANPPSPVWEHFESEHVIQQPSYASKYPPAQGLSMAVGEALTGQPLLGAWLGMALACGAVCWMLQGWAPPRWALLGGIVVATHFGMLAWWAQGYWGGQMAMLGGALVFGSVRRLVDLPRVRTAVLLGAGLAVLANSRPYEGFMAAIPAAILLGTRLLGPGRPPVMVSMRRIVLPATMVLALAAAATLRYNERVTGEGLRLPYQHHSALYSATPMFLFQDAPPEPVYRDRKLRDFHAGWERTLFERQRTAMQITRRTIQKCLMFGGFYFGAALFAGLLGLLPSLRRRPARPASSDGWIALAAATAVWALAASLVCVWFNPHYVAPVACLLVLLSLEGLRRIRARSRRGRAIARAILAGHLAAVPMVFGATAVVYPDDDWSVQRLRMMDRLAADGGRHLIILRHGRECRPHQEWVYNGADLDGAPVLWSRELDSRSARRLLEHYPDRKAWLFLAYRPGQEIPELVPYPRLPAWVDGDQRATGPPERVEAVAGGDFDGDGRPDIAFAPAERGSLCIIMSAGGSRGEPLAIALPGPATTLVARDLDGDGASDLAAMIGSTGQVVVVRSNGRGGPGPAAVYGVGTTASGLSAGDFDGDGHVDLAAARSAAGETDAVVVLRNHGDGTFETPVVAAALAGPSAIIAADLDGDGRDDLAGTEAAAGTVAILLHTGGPGMAFGPGLRCPTGTNPVALAAGDLRGDGSLSLIVANEGDDTVTVLSRGPDGLWAGRGEPTGVRPSGMALTDVDADGRLDIAVATREAHGLTILRSRPGGGFDAPGEVTLGTQTWYARKAGAIAAADLDGDGIGDLILGIDAGGLVIRSGGAVISSPPPRPAAARPSAINSGAAPRGRGTGQ